MRLCLAFLSRWIYRKRLFSIIFVDLANRNVNGTSETLSRSFSINNLNHHACSRKKDQTPSLQDMHFYNMKPVILKKYSVRHYSLSLYNISISLNGSVIWILKNEEKNFKSEKNPINFCRIRIGLGLRKKVGYPISEKKSDIP